MKLNLLVIPLKINRENKTNWENKSRGHRGLGVGLFSPYTRLWCTRGWGAPRPLRSPLAPCSRSPRQLARQIGDGLGLLPARGQRLEYGPGRRCCGAIRAEQMFDGVRGMGCGARAGTGAQVLAVQSSIPADRSCQHHHQAEIRSRGGCPGIRSPLRVRDSSFLPIFILLPRRCCSVTVIWGKTPRS